MRGFWRVLGAFIGGFAMGGPMGGAAAAAAQLSKEIFGWRPTHIEAQLMQWTETHIGPHFRELLEWSNNIRDLTPTNLSQFNYRFSELYAYKAYWEHVMLKSRGDELLLAEAKVEALDGYIQILNESLIEYFPTASYGYSFYPVNFDATGYEVVAGEILRWQGVKTVIAEKLVFADEKPSTGGGSTQTGGGTTIGGGSQTTIGGGPIKTGSGTIKTGGGSQTTGGGGTTQTTIGGGSTQTGGGTTQTGGGSQSTGVGNPIKGGAGTTQTPGIIPIGSQPTQTDGGYPTSQEPTVHIPAVENKSKKLLTYLGIAAIGYLVLKK